MKQLKALLLLLCLSATSCIQMLNNAADVVTESAKQNSVDTTPRTYNTISVDSLYSLDIPFYMKEIKELNPDASLSFGNIYKEAYTIVIHENKQEFVDNFKFYNEYNDEIPLIENYALAQKRMLKEQLINFRFQDYGLIQLNQYPARQTKIFGQFDDVNAAYLIAYIEGPENVYMIMNWTVNDRMNGLDLVYEHINGTFKLL